MREWDQALQFTVLPVQICGNIESGSTTGTGKPDVKIKHM